MLIVTKLGGQINLHSDTEYVILEMVETNTALFISLANLFASEFVVISQRRMG